MKLKGLIFDFGFTLFEFKEVSVEKYFDCYRRGLKRAIKKLKELKILNEDQIIKKFIKTFNKERASSFKKSIETKIESPTSHLFKYVFEILNFEEFPYEFYEELATIYHSCEEEEWIPFKKTRETLEKISNLKIKMAVLSNHPHHTTIENLLKKHDLFDYFTAIVTSAEFGKRKPDPEIFLYTLNKMGLTTPELCLVCGDEHADIVGGHRAGLQTILCKRIFKFPFEREIDVPNYIIVNDISEIINFIS